MDSGNNLIIKSRDRKTPSDDASSCIIRLGQPIIGSYQIVGILLANTIYNVDASNNVIYFRENSTNKSATITAGYYTHSTIAAAVKSALDTASGGYNTFTVAVDASTKKITASAGNAFSFNFSRNTTGVGAEDVLGAVRYADTSAATSLTMSNVCNLSTPMSVLMSIQQVTGNSYCSFGDNLGRQIIGNIHIPLDVGFGSVKYVETLDNPTRIDFYSTDSLNIRIIDVGTGATRSLNGGDFEIILRRL